MGWQGKGVPGPPPGKLDHLSCPGEEEGVRGPTGLLGLQSTFPLPLSKTQHAVDTFHFLCANGTFLEH